MINGNSPRRLCFLFRPVAKPPILSLRKDFRESWSAFRDWGWNTFSFFADDFLAAVAADLPVFEGAMTFEERKKNALFTATCRVGALSFTFFAAFTISLYRVPCHPAVHLTLFDALLKANEYIDTNSRLGTYVHSLDLSHLIRLLIN